MRYIIDRFEEGLAICEDEEKNMIPIDRSRLPEGVKEGDILTEQDGLLSPDPQAAASRRQAMEERLNKLFK